MTKKLMLVLGVLIAISMILGACAQPTAEEVVKTVIVTQEVEKEVVKTEVVEKEVVVTEVVEVMPTAEPVDRKGGWLDTLIFLEEPSAEAAVTRLDVGEMDVYAYTVNDAELFATVQTMDNIAYSNSYGSYNELTMNPAVVEGDLNPFSSQKIREAMHWLVDREYMVEEIFGGLARPRYAAFSTVFPDYAKTAATQAALAAKYAYDPEKAATVINEEMTAMGAEMVDGKWTYNGEPVDIIFLIRVEDERRDIGDYVSNQLESVGFTVDRQYKTSAEAGVLWVQSDPLEGLWHLYTAGWISNFVNRDLATNFEFFFTPRGYPIPLWQIYDPSPELDTCADRLNRNDFATLEERTQLMDECLTLSNEFAVRVFLMDRASFIPRRIEAEVASDLAAGVAGGRMNPFAIRFADEVGGSMTVGMPSILTEPMNPISGSNWVYDAAVWRAITDWGMMVDPFTGLRYPQRIEKAEVVVKEGLPAGLGNPDADWITLEFAPEIQVPDDAWVDWDAVNQVWITASEKFTDTQTANQLTRVYYPADFYETTWHDGSNFSVGDIVMYMIMTFDRGKPDSPVFSSEEEATLQAFLDQFKGVKIVSTDPLVIETYSDNYYLEVDLVDQNYSQTWYPVYNYGPGAWHNITLGWLPDAAGELAFSANKADELEVEWISYIGGPSLDIMAGYLETAAAENIIPYAPTMSQFVTEEEAATRWANLQEWYRRRGHFMIGTGPYYLEGAFPIEGTVILNQYPAFPDNSDRWAGFTSPRVAVVEVDGPGRVDIGAEAAFDVFVTFAGEPYPADDISGVSYLVFDATGALVLQGEAEAAGEGQYTITLSGDQTSQLQAGANRLDVVVVSKVVAIPGTGSFEFVTQ